jgi:hypothetical protein
MNCDGIAIRNRVKVKSYKDAQKVLGCEFGHLAACSPA